MFLVSVSFAAPATIGVASAPGTFQVNSAEVDGNANLFEGSELIAGKSPGQILLQSGVSLTLSAGTSAAIFHDHVLLRQGVVRIESLSGFSVSVAIYRVEQDQPASQAVIRLSGDLVQVGALSGSLRVLDSHGALLTRVGTGTVSSFGPAPSVGTSASSPASPNNNNTKRKRAAEAMMSAAALAALYLLLTNLPDSNPTSP